MDIQNVNTDSPFAAIITPPTTSALEQAKTDIAKIEDAIKNLESIGGDICAAELVIMRQKRDDLIAKAKAEAVNNAQEVQEVEQSFLQRYGTGLAHGAEILLLLAILVRLFGVI